jgi:hypothetical protein
MIARRARPTNPVQPIKPFITLPLENAVGTNANARIVEFIAKPNKTEELQGFLRQSVRSFLLDQTGLIGFLVLTFLQEPRRVLVMTFWRTEELAERGAWEETPMVHELLSPLIDAWSRIRTYKIHLPEATAPCEVIAFAPELSIGSNPPRSTALP